MRRSLLRRIAGRVVLAFVTIAFLSAVTFAATTALPADPASAALGEFAPQERKDEFRRERGLDRPLPKQFADWAGSAVRLDFGSSYVTGRPVWDTLADQLRRTGVLALAAILLALPTAVAIGAYVGKRPGRRADAVASSSSLVIASQPEFNVGLILIGIFALWLGVLPLQSSALSSPQPFADQIRLYALPVATLAIVVAPYLLRLTRAAVRDERRQPYVRAARLRGSSEAALTWRQILPNVAPPLVTATALVLAEMVGGFVVVEYLYAFPGVGQRLVDSIQNGDIPVVQAIVVVLGTIVVLLNLAADIVVDVLSPSRGRTP